MATGGGYPSLSKTSEEIFDSECFDCSQDGKHVQAEVFCVECGNNMCKRCRKDHNKFPQLRTHHIKNKSAVKLGTAIGALHPPSEKCTEHDGRLIDTYCSRHDAVCCSVCVSENHRSCPDVSYIPKVASGISTSKELQDAQTSTKTLKTRLNTLKETREENLKDIRKQRNEALERAAMYKDELIKRIEELGKRTAADIMDKYTQLEDTISGDLDELSKLIEALDVMDGKLKRFSDDETKLFVHLKTCKQYISAGEKLEKTCSPPFGPDTFTFDPNISIETFLKRLTALGKFVENTNYSDAHLFDGNITAVHLSDENSKSSADTDTCRITGICSLEDGGLMIVDFRNSCLKKLDKSFKIESRCALSSAPWYVCQTSRTEVAVTMWDANKIQFVSVGQALAWTRSFTTHGNGKCTGIAYRDGHIYVSKYTQRSCCSVQVYDINGTLLQNVQNDKAGTELFNGALHIAVSARTSNIYVTDYNNGLIIMDKSGQLVTTTTEPDLSGAYGVCMLPRDQLLVCGRTSDNIIQFDAQGKKVGTLLNSADCLWNPETLYFDPDRSILVVGMYKIGEIIGDTIKVYSLVKK